MPPEGAPHLEASDDEGKSEEPDQGQHEHQHRQTPIAESRGAMWKKFLKDLQEPVQTIPLLFCERIASKEAPVVLRAVQRIYTGIRMLGLSVRRIHSDQGRGFCNRLMDSWCASRDICSIFSIPSDPKGNGCIEAFVGLVKAGVRSLLSASQLSPRHWPGAARQWTEQRLRRSLACLGAQEPRALTPFGTKVAVRNRAWNRKAPHDSRTIQGTAIGPSMRTAGATVLRIEDPEESAVFRFYVAPVTYKAVQDVVKFQGAEQDEASAQGVKLH